MINYLEYQTEKRFKEILQDSWIRSLYSRDRAVDEGIWHQIRNKKPSKTSITLKEFEKLIRDILKTDKK